MFQTKALDEHSSHVGCNAVSWNKKIQASSPLGSRRSKTSRPLHPLVTQIKKSRRLHPQYHADQKDPNVFTLRVTQIKKIQTSSRSESRRSKRYRRLHAQGHADQKDSSNVDDCLLWQTVLRWRSENTAGYQKFRIPQSPASFWW
jgi:hypothetical protein